MNPQFRLTQPAMQDIQETAEDLAQNFGFSQAERFVQKLNIQFSRIVQFPQMGKTRNDILLGVRTLLVDRHLIFYIPIRDDIEILRVVSGYRDLSKLFIDEE